MNTSFVKLLTVVLEHSYFNDNKFKEYRITPTTATATKLARVGIRMKQLDNQFILIAEKRIQTWLQDDSKAGKRGEPFLPLVFAIQPTNPYFGNYTEPEESPATGKIFCFKTSTGSRSPVDDGIKPVGGVAPAHLDLQWNDRLLTNLPTDTEQIDIRLDNAFGSVQPWAVLIVDSLPKELSPTFKIAIKSRATIWRYVIRKRDRLLSENGPNLNDLRIVVGPDVEINPEQIGEGVFFHLPAPIALKKVNTERYQLIDAPANRPKRVIIQNLPRPDVNSFVKPKEKDNKKTYSEILIYI
ncbi:hypothetical protein LC612_37535 [Nostoc sp. CHAB 5834]|nr:hypothetical protein [Nostoc sp. CHAB 5834]